MAGLRSPASAAARRYARALFQAALDHRALVAVARDVERLEGVAGRPDVAAMLADPRVEPAGKRAALDQGLGSGLHPLTLGLLDVVARRRRHAVLPELPAAFGELRDAHEGLLRGLVESASPLEPEEKASLEVALSARTGRKVRLEGAVSRELLGGVRVTLGGTRYDGSALAQVRGLKRRMAAAELGTG